ncbi:MAG TPA: hypothetical protein VK524_13535, partial [Polyangiaceae bacterium]|nr:hypothetical protein [Polyangiaceae bacterium]
ARSVEIVKELRLGNYAQIFAGDADRLSGGRVLVTDSLISRGEDANIARISEVELETSNIVWQLRLPNTVIYRTLPVSRLPGEVASR